MSADHYISPIPGHLYTSFGREQRGYSCGTLFVDHASGKIFNFPQLSTTTAETVRSKHTLERLAHDEGIVIKHYHSDNGVFASTAFRADCESQSQQISFSGVGAHHQNGIAERNIKTISQWARANMLHAAFHWHEHANIKLWPQAIDYAIWVFNRLPSATHGLSPNELWSGSRSSGHDLRRTHPFGCPVFVLDPSLQDGKKIPKWDTRARRGMFVGFSPHHSSLVPLVLNIATGKITPQFHVIFDDKFHTVMSLPTGTTLRDEWLNILAFGNDCFLDVEPLHNDDAPHRDLLPHEFLDWLRHSPSTDTTTISHTDSSTELDARFEPTHTPSHDDPPLVPDTSREVTIPAPEGDTLTEDTFPAPEGVTTPAPRRNPSRHVGTWKDGPAKI
jgi:hypothetical protein